LGDAPLGEKQVVSRLADAEFVVSLLLVAKKKKRRLERER
jgi:hypothetical protein